MRSCNGKILRSRGKYRRLNAPLAGSPEPASIKDDRLSIAPCWSSRHEQSSLGVKYGLLSISRWYSLWTTSNACQKLAKFKATLERHFVEYQLPGLTQFGNHFLYMSQNYRLICERIYPDDMVTVSSLWPLPEQHEAVCLVTPAKGAGWCWKPV